MKKILVLFITVGLLIGNMQGYAATTKTNFKNCTELRKVYPNGVSKKHKAYQAKMDRDKDGYACEKN